MAEKKKEPQRAAALMVSGTRKEAVARALIRPGSGKLIINQQPLASFSPIQRLLLQEPFVLAEPILGEQLKKLDIIVKAEGGGAEGQIDAARLAIARALVAYTKSAELKKVFTRYDRTLLVADTRRKEMRKWGDSKARAKRQKSFR